MSSFTSLTLNTKTYAPSGMQNGIAAWTERSSAYAAGFSTLTQKVWGPNGTEGAYHSQSKLTLPVVATASDEYERVGEEVARLWADIHISIGKRASAAERLDLYNRIKDYVATDAFKLSITNLEGVFIGGA